MRTLSTKMNRFIAAGMLGLLLTLGSAALVLAEGSGAGSGGAPPPPIPGGLNSAQVPHTGSHTIAQAVLAE